MPLYIPLHRLFKASSRPTQLIFLPIYPILCLLYPSSSKSKSTCPTTENQAATTAATDAPHTTPTRATTVLHTSALHTNDPPTKSTAAPHTKDHHTKNTGALPTSARPTKASAVAPTTAVLTTPAPLPLLAHRNTPLPLSPTAGSRNGSLAPAAHSSWRPLLAGLSGRSPLMLRMVSSRVVVVSPILLLCRRRIRPMRVDTRLSTRLSIPPRRATVANTPRRRRRRRAIKGSTLLRARLGWRLVLLAVRFWVMSLLRTVMALGLTVKRRHITPTMGLTRWEVDLPFYSRGRISI